MRGVRVPEEMMPCIRGVCRPSPVSHATRVFLILVVIS